MEPKFFVMKSVYILSIIDQNINIRAEKVNFSFNSQRVENPIKR